MFRAFVMVLVTSLFMNAPVQAIAQDSVADVVKKMKEAFEPTQSSMRKVEIVARGPNGEQITWIAHQAREQQAEGKRTLLVMQEPEYARGDALLIWERQEQPNAMWWYTPALRRVRELLPVEAYQRLFDSDLTYADLGYVERQGAYRVLGREDHNGQQTYKVELAPEPKVYYSRILTWINADSFLPVQREYYDMAGRLWKTMTFDHVQTIDGLPTPLHMAMHDVQQDSGTDVTFSEVRYGVDLPQTLFEPDHLPQTVEARWWQPSTAPVAAGK